MDPLEEATKERLLSSVVRGAWPEVIRVYREYPASRMVKIPKSGDTAIHIAISNGLEHIVEILVSLCEEEALAIGNDRGDTPLHLAAAAGSVRMCLCIAKKNFNLIGSRNETGETPLFLAVSNGNMSAFLLLQRICEKAGHQCAYYRRDNGDTILHSAISHEYYAMAFYIIHWYRELAYKVNEDGISPLHLLANKPSSFPSGTRLVGLRKLVYNCIHVSELQERGPNSKYVREDFIEDLVSPRMDDAQDKVSTVMCPENYRTCIRCLHLLAFCTRVLAVRSDPHGKQPDIENQLSNSDPDLTTPANRPRRFRGRGHQSFFPPNYITCLSAVRLVIRLVLKVIPGYEEMVIKRIQEKEKNTWSVQVLDLLLQANSLFPYKWNGMNGGQQRNYVKELDEVLPYLKDGDGQFVISDKQDKVPPSLKDGHRKRVRKDGDRKMIETPLLIAAKNGVLEVVEGILHFYPDAIFDVNNENKNIVMLAAENRHLPLYKFLLNSRRIMKTIFGEVDQDGNSALHIAATMPNRQPWRVRGAALQMHMEVKWYQYVKHSMPPGFFARYNHRNQTPGEIFRDTHQDVMEEGRQWLIDNSQSCSLVAALIATVAFATSATFPGGVKQDSGTPTLEDDPIFVISAVLSLIALCFSMISVVTFLGILTSSFQLKDFRKDLPRRLLLGLISLLVSIVSMLVSFFAGHHFVLKGELGHRATSVYVLLCLPLLVFIMIKFPLDFETSWTILNHDPERYSK